MPDARRARLAGGARRLRAGLAELSEPGRPVLADRVDERLPDGSRRPAAPRVEDRRPAGVLGLPAADGQPAAGELGCGPAALGPAGQQRWPRRDAGLGRQGRMAVRLRDGRRPAAPRRLLDADERPRLDGGLGDTLGGGGTGRGTAGRDHPSGRRAVGGQDRRGRPEHQPDRLGVAPLGPPDPAGLGAVGPSRPHRPQLREPRHRGRRLDACQRGRVQPGPRPGHAQRP